MFNPAPRIERVPLGEHGSCLVVDDALQDPEALRRFAEEQRARFVHAPFNAYPGIELGLTGPIQHALSDFFDRHIRGLLGSRRTLRMNCRLAMATTPPEQLEPRQWLCHRDSAWIERENNIAASVLYLFEDAGFGGTSFYAPRRSADQIARLVHDSGTMGRVGFSARYHLQPGYMAEGNEWFDRIGRVDARWNRIIFYDGRLFHSGEIGSEQALCGEPMHGRLTLNGFYTCSRKAA